MRSLWIAVGLTGCWTGSTQPTSPKPVVEPPSEPVAESEQIESYRAVTITVDAIGVAALTAGLIGLERGGHDDRSGALMVAGALTASYGSPIVHFSRGTKARGAGSLVIRSLSATVGMMIGIGAGSCKSAGPLTQLDCALEGMLWGTAAGLAAGSIIDALVLHDQPAQERPTWVPTVTPDHGGASIGIAGGF